MRVSNQTSASPSGKETRFEDIQARIQAEGRPRCGGGISIAPGSDGKPGAPGSDGKPGAPGADGGGSDDPIATTLAIGEEDGGGGVGGDPIATTQAIGEEDGGGGDEGPVVTTQAIGEEDGGGAPGGEDGNRIIGGKGDDVLTGTDGDDRIAGRRGNDTITTGQGDDRVRGGQGDDTIAVTGTGDKRINGGKGHDTLELKGQASDYAIRSRANGATVYTAADGSRIVARNIETVTFTGAVAPEPPDGGGFTASFALAPNALGATSLDISGDTATLTGPDTDFTFTGVDASGIAADGPIIATGGSGTINGEETTAVALSPFGPAVLTIGSGFNPTGTQDVNAAFANGASLSTTVA